MSLNRDGLLYRFAKACETPPLNRSYWLLLNYLYCSGMIFVGRSIYFIFRYRFTCKMVLFPNFSKGDIHSLRRKIDIIKKSNDISDSIIIMENDCAHDARRLFDDTIIGIPAPMITALSKYVLFSKPSRIVMSQPWYLVSTKSANIGLQDSVIEDHTKYSTSSLVAGHSVILSPYEQTISVLGYSTPSSMFWEKLASELQQRGFKVYTNCDGNKEKPIADTEALYPPIDEIASYVEFAGYSVSVRSGFSDWASDAPTARQVVLYPSAYYLRKYSLANSSSGSIYECLYDDRNIPIESSVYKIADMLIGGDVCERMQSSESSEGITTLEEIRRA